MSVIARGCDHPKEPQFSLDIRALNLSPRASNVDKLVTIHERYIYDHSPASSPRDIKAKPVPSDDKGKGKAKAALMRSLPIHVSQAASSSSSVVAYESSSDSDENEDEDSFRSDYKHKGRRHTDPIFFDVAAELSRGGRLCRSPKMKFRLTPRSKSHHAVSRASSSSSHHSISKARSDSTLKADEKKEEDSGFEEYSLVSKRRVTGHRTAFPLANPYQDQIENIYRCIFEKYTEEIGAPKYKRDSTNYMLILNEKGKLSWAYTTHFNSVGLGSSSATRELPLNEIVERAEMACNMILTVIKDCQRVGFEHIIEKEFRTFGDKDRSISQTTEARIKLIALFEKLLKSQTGKTVLSQSAVFENRLKGFYWKILYREFVNEGRAMLQFLTKEKREISVILEAVEKDHKTKIRHYKRKSLRSKSIADISENEMDTFFDQIGMASVVSGVTFEEKTGYLKKILSKSSTVSGYNGRHIEDYTEFFDRASEGMGRCLAEAKKIRADLDGYVRAEPHLSSQRDELEGYLRDWDYGNATFRAFWHTQREMNFYMEAFPKMLKLLSIRACSLVRRGPQREKLRKELLQALQCPIQWHSLENTFRQIADYLSKKSRRKS